MIKKSLCILLLILFFSFSVFANDRATLFTGDSVWKNDSLLTFIETDGKGLLPVSVFGEFGIEVILSEKLGSLLLIRGEDFLSYNLGSGKVLDEGGNIEKTSIYRYGGEIYLEPKSICDKFSLTLETTYASDGYLAARLTDGSESLEFSELLKLYTEKASQPLPFLLNPTGKTVPGSFMHPIILTPAAASVKNIVKLLGTNRATFALDPDRIADYISVIPDIFAAGHTVAYHMDLSDISDPASFEEEMIKANEWLFAFIGKTSKIYVSSEALKRIPKIEGYAPKSCGTHLVAGDLVNDDVVNITLGDPQKYGYIFSLASDAGSRNNYSAFFGKFKTFTHLRSMPLSVSGENH